MVQLKLYEYRESNTQQQQQQQQHSSKFKDMVKVKATLPSCGKFAVLLSHHEGFITINSVTVNKCLYMFQKVRSLCLNTSFSQGA